MVKYIDLRDRNQIEMQSKGRNYIPLDPLINRVMTKSDIFVSLIFFKFNQTKRKK